MVRQGGDERFDEIQGRIRELASLVKEAQTVNQAQVEKIKEQVQRVRDEITKQLDERLREQNHSLARINIVHETVDRLEEDLDKLVKGPQSLYPVLSDIRRDIENNMKRIDMLEKVVFGQGGDESSHSRRLANVEQFVTSARKRADASEKTKWWAWTALGAAVLSLIKDMMLAWWITP